jgi:hypothetical protein
MTSALPPYTTHNIRAAAGLLAVLASYIAYAADLLTGMRANDRHGYEGEAAGLGVALLLLLMLYLLPFAIGASLAALRRGSRPVSGGVLLLALLPTGGVVLFMLVIWLNALSK